MAAVPIAHSPGKGPETLGIELWVDPEASWAEAGGPGYVDEAPEED